jgi:hypothetical protein
MQFRNFALVALLRVCLSDARADDLATEKWPQALARMPLLQQVRELNSTNCVDLMLRSFTSNPVVKGLIFMPGAADEFYMFRRAKARLTKAPPTLLDAVVSLTNQTLIQATYQDVFLLLHTEQDSLQPVIAVKSDGAVQQIRRSSFPPHVVCVDRDWDFVQPLLADGLGLEVRPWRGSIKSFHFYRHNFAGWSLSGWEAVNAVALAGKSKASLLRKWEPLPQNVLIFEPDSRGVPGQKPGAG